MNVGRRYGDFPWTGDKLKLLTVLFVHEAEISPCQPLETFVFPAFAALSMTVTRKKMKKNYEAE